MTMGVDCMLYDQDGVKRYALEVAHTHFTGKLKIDQTRQDGIGIAEFAVEDVILLVPRPRNLKNFLLVREKCKVCLHKEIQDSTLQVLMKEVKVWLDYDTTVYTAIDKERKSKLLEKTCLS